MALIKPEQLRSGSYNITGSLFGTSSYAEYALTASFALNGGGGGSSFPFTGSAIITGSLVVTGSVKATAGFTGSLQGTASLATFATTANFANNANLASTALLANEPVGDWIPQKPDPNGISPYNLGSPTAAWNSLYVNHGTIFFLSESFGSPTISSSFSVEDDPDGSSRFILGTKKSGSITENIVISNKGASLAITASFAQTASFVQNAQTASFINPTFISQSAANSGFGAGSGGSFISTGSITASVDITGDIFIIRSGSYNPFTVSSTGLTTISGSATNLFLIKNASNQPILTVSQSGIVTLATQSMDPIGTAPNGAIYFTSDSFFIGLD